MTSERSPSRSEIFISKLAAVLAVWFSTGSLTRSVWNSRHVCTFVCLVWCFGTTWAAVVRFPLLFWSHMDEHLLVIYCQNCVGINEMLIFLAHAHHYLYLYVKNKCNDDCNLFNWYIKNNDTLYDKWLMYARMTQCKCLILAHSFSLDAVRRSKTSSTCSVMMLLI